MTYNFHLSCKHTHLSFKSVCNKEHIKRSNMTSPSNSSKALVLQDECFAKNYSSFLDSTRNYERWSGIFCPWSIPANILSRATTGKAFCCWADSGPLLFAYWDDTWPLWIPDHALIFNNYAPVIFNHGPQPLGRARDSRVCFIQSQ